MRIITEIEQLRKAKLGKEKTYNTDIVVINKRSQSRIKTNKMDIVTDAVSVQTINNNLVTIKSIRKIRRIAEKQHKLRCKMEKGYYKALDDVEAAINHTYKKYMKEISKD